MRSPHQTTDTAACLARIGLLEDQRRCALLLGQSGAGRAEIDAIVRRQQADALAFARRGAP